MDSLFEKKISPLVQNLFRPPGGLIKSRAREDGAMRKRGIFVELDEGNWSHWAEN
jgi:hypothetical protein